MNFLAHCLIGARVAGPMDNLTGDHATHATDVTSPHNGSWQAPLVAGGFLGDFLKGPVPADMPEALALGVRLHRRVDAYSNRALLIRRSCNRYPTELRRFAPVFVDIVADHLLAASWSTHHSAALTEFTDSTYSNIDEHRHWMSDSARRFLDYAIASDLFARYQDWSVIERALDSIARRIRRPELGAHAAAVSLQLYEDLAADFEVYFPDILNHAAEWTGQQISVAQ